MLTLKEVEQLSYDIFKASTKFTSTEGEHFKVNMSNVLELLRSYTEGDYKYNLNTEYRTFQFFSEEKEVQDGNKN